MHLTRSLPRMLILFIVILLAALPVLSGCAPRRAARAEAPPASPPANPIASSETSSQTVPTRFGACLCDTEAQMAMAAPRNQLPPTVVAISPERGEEQRLNAPLVITFDQPMDPATTAAAFHIEPPVEGQATVMGKTLTFQPAQPWPRATAFKVTVDATARGLNGLTLTAPFEHRFTTVGYLEVTSVQPADGASDVPTDTSITIVFNRPVVPLTGVEEQAGLPQPLKLEPAITGRGEWLNTSIYTFRPSEPLAATTRYTITVPAGLTDHTGGILAQDYTWTFTTTSPIVVNMAPTTDQVPPTSPITITFSQPMDPASTEAAFSLRTAKDNVPVEGMFTWQDEGRTLVYQPKQPLAYGAGYVVNVDKTARPARGEGTLRQATRFSFRVVRLPGVRSTTPKDGDQAADPYGAMEVTFHSPIDPNTLGPGAIRVEPEPTQVYTWYNEYESRLIISWERQPRTAYTVTLGSQIGDRYGNTLGRDVVIRFRTRDYDPMAYLGGFGPIGTYNAYTRTIATASYRNVSRLDFGLYQVNETTFLSLTGEQSWDAWQRLKLDEAALLNQWSVDVSPPPNVIRTWQGPLTDSEGKPLPPGLYLLELRAPEIRYSPDRLPSRQLLIVSRLNISLKHTDTEALTWVTDLKTGEPVADLPLRLLDGQGLEISGRTDAQGVFRTTFEQRDYWKPLYIFAGQLGADDFAVVLNQWSNGISPWEFGLNVEMYKQPLNAYLYTDRPIYRPGQTVHWKAILRWDDDARYSLPAAGMPVTITVNDSFGNQVLQERKSLSPLGTVYGDFTLAPEASLGWYNIDLQVILPELPPERREQHYSVGFQVAEYRKPEYEISVTTERPEYVQGDIITVTAKANYFFGGPVKDAEVRWSLLSWDYFFNYQGEGWYSFQDFKGWDYYRPEYYRFGEPLAQGQGKTDAEGQFTFSVPADIADRDQSQTFTFDVRITDVNGQEVAGSAAAVVHKAAIYVGLSPREYVGTVGEPNHVDLITVDPQSQSIASVPVTIVVSLAKWYSVQEKSDDGRFYWTSKVEETPVLTRTLTTDAQGRATLTWTPTAGGQYLVRARAEDERGNATASAVFVWISGRLGEFVPWRMESNDRINLVADKKEYQVGDTAQVLVPSPYPGPVWALLTIERGHILSHQVITLTSNSQTLSIPILSEFAPNIFVSILIVQGQDEQNPLPSFKLGYVELPVSTAEKELQVTLRPNAAVVAPRSPVTYTIEVRDHVGRPVKAELSLALVDKAVLTLTDPNVEPILDRFYRKRGLGVNTALGLAINLDRLVQQQVKGTKGGGGGPGEGPTVRREFPDSALWAPAVQTNEQGRAQVSLVLPDNLTTWRLIGKGVTAETLVGEATVDIVATKELLVRPVAPRFFVAGDAADVGAVVHNTTKSDQQVEITFTAQGLSVDGPARQAITVAAESAVRVDWPVRVQPGNQAVLLFDARSGELSDAVEITLPVYRYTTPEIVGTSGEVAADEARLEVVHVPAGAQPNQGELTVMLEPTLAASMLPGLRYLEHYPYECTEQVLSRFLPNVLTYQAMKRLGIERPDLAEKLSHQLGIGLQRLYSRQNVDGGWGWWYGERSNPFISAYVVFGLVQVKKAGFSVDEDILDRGIRYLHLQLQAPAKLQGYALNRQAFMIYVLADAGRNVMSQAATLYEERERLALYGRAFLALAFGVMDAEGQRARIDTLISDLTGRAVLSATGAHWEEAGTPDYWTMNTDVRTTAVILDLLARFGSTGGIAPNAVRWLMNVRKDGHWETTQETAWSLIALTDWMLATGELEGDYSWRVRLNDEDLGQGAVNRDNLDDPVVLKTEIARLLLDQANRLSIERSTAEGQTGRGRLYYTTHLQYYLPVESIQPRDRGIVIARRYTLTDDPQKPITQAKAGDVIQVELTIVAPNDLHYLVVEDPLPAGAEAIDVSLRTTSRMYQGPQMEEVPSEEEAQSWWWDRWVPTHTELRDEKVVLFATWLPRGTYRYTYQIRASLPGRYLTLPATAYQMYFPEVWGRSAGGVFTIVR
ncbi:MAG: Ig-like domain-containing protein [Anaerolineae bacterium]|nr:Ig-like domain-containing protein [Anaerolineae bacterium]MDW8099949.1 Ig-like domain-containing protein [Anaerolineae bacterium]